VDGSLAFVGGFCVGQEWAGSAKAPPWRDTGIEIRGPAAAVAGWSFERIWATLGDPIPTEVQVHPDQVPPQGKASCWVFEGLPRRSRVLRSTLLVAAAARRRIWITDPYFVAPRTVAEALRAAARDGVDVRILVPSKNNWPWVGSLSRGGYRELLRSGVRLFEWQGSMIHAKTLVSDGIWARVGSSNMNSASLLGNWEIDIGVLDQDFARQMEGLFLADLASAVEIVLPGRASTSRRTDVAQREVSAGSASLEPPESLQGRLELWRAGGGSSGSTGSRIADLVRAGSTLGNAIAGRRTLGREDRALLGALALALLLVTVLAFFFPTVVAGVVAVLSGWLGLVVGVRVVVQRRAARLGDGVDTFEDRGVE
jgi:cardiolipin synthase